MKIIKSDLLGIKQHLLKNNDSRDRRQNLILNLSFNEIFVPPSDKIWRDISEMLGAVLFSRHLPKEKMKELCTYIPNVRFINPIQTESIIVNTTKRKLNFGETPPNNNSRQNDNPGNSPNPNGSDTKRLRPNSEERKEKL